jgi:RimJ/RimL family protein N-acetyltransferase
MSDEGFTFGTTLPTLAAGRLRLRWLTEADVPSLFAIFGDAEVTRYWGFAVLPDQTAAAALLADVHDHFRRRSLLQWGVELVQTGELIGTCTLAHLDSANRRAELGFALGRAHWGQGYMAEALRVLLRFAFVELRLHRVMADADPRNARSMRALERLGFRREGLLRQHYLVQGEAQDAVVYGLLRSESPWAERATNRP